MRSRTFLYLFVTIPFIIVISAVIILLSDDPVSDTSGQSPSTPQESQLAIAHGSLDVMEPIKTTREVTAYTASINETDDSPCVGATGMNICEIAESGINVCASNAFPIGTYLTIDNLGDCVVFDRMNSRYQNRVDWFMGYDKERAIQFGIQRLYVTDRGIYE